MPAHTYHRRAVGGWQKIPRAEVHGLAAAGVEVVVRSPRPDGGVVAWVVAAAILGPTGRVERFVTQEDAAAAEAAGQPVRRYRAG